MRSFLGNAIMDKENKKKGQVMNIINKLSGLFVFVPAVEYDRGSRQGLIHGYFRFIRK